VESPRQLPSAQPAHGARRHARRRSLVLFALLAVLLHAMLLGGPDWAAPGEARAPVSAAAMAVRRIESEPVPAAAEAAPAVAEPAVPRPVPPPRPRRPQAAAERAPRSLEPPAPAASTPVVVEAALEPEPPLPAPSASEPAPVASAPSPAAVEAVPAASAPAPAPAASSSFLAAGELPPPTYRTKLPPSVTLRYEVRRGFLRGSGEIRWQHVGDDYGLRLEARIAGLTLLAQTSQGVVSAAGLAPVRFLDQRARRSPQAANFQRESEKVTFSGPSTVWPLLPGSQDQLSWMIQLAGIVAAEPDRAREGGQIAMVIVGARGDASVRTLRFAGQENASTVAGPVPALKFVVAARSAYDSSYEIWLDPARDFLPVHATRRNSAGDSDFDLLLEGIEPIP
jgi:hypothetical protein